jgi:hypothetical protein
VSSTVRYITHHIQPDVKVYFLPIDANLDNAISIDEMNVAFASVGESPVETLIFLRFIPIILTHRKMIVNMKSCL